MTKRIYIRSSEQISLQQPLSEAWINAPVPADKPYMRAADPDFRQWLSPAESRRMGRILKRALVTALEALRRAEIERPDAILVGTGLGCMENTERLLETLCRDGESMLSPTHFMQSTHNTLAALLAIHTKAHGYNITYSHKDLSFDLALWDARTQLLQGAIHTALVGGYDELTPSYFTLLERIGYMGGGMPMTGSEAAVSMLLTDCEEGALCELAAMRVLYRPTEDELRQALDEVMAEAGIVRDGLSGVLTGIHGNPKVEAAYNRLTGALLPGVPTLRYQHLFGTSYTASAYAVHVAAHCLACGTLPETLRYGAAPLRTGRSQALLLLNQRAEKHYSLTILRALCGN